MNNSTFLKYIILLFLGMLFNSCASKKNILYLQDFNNLNISKVISFQNILSENDIIRIEITSLEMKASEPFNKILDQTNGGNLDLMQLRGYLVSKNKTINFPILGEISVAGKTTKDLENYLKKRLQSEGYLINPNVSVRLLNAKFTILGEVNKPGTYTFTEKNISLLQAIGMSGDLTIDGNRKDVIIIREINEERISTTLDLTSSKWLNTSYQNIHPNDVIIVNPNSKKVTSAGLIGNLSSMLSIASILLSTIILIR